jgi:hypothetical protein
MFQTHEVPAPSQKTDTLTIHNSTPDWPSATTPKRQCTPITFASTVPLAPYALSVTGSLLEARHATSLVPDDRAHFKIQARKDIRDYEVYQASVIAVGLAHALPSVTSVCSWLDCSIEWRISST